MIAPNMAIAHHFLRLLDNTAIWTFQTFDDRIPASGCPKRPHLSRILTGTLDEHFNALMGLSAGGAGVFVTVNRTDGQGRKLENITEIRAVWQETDKLDTPFTPLLPHIVVESSPGKFHRYLLVAPTPVTPETTTQFSLIMRELVANHGSDPNAKDLARVLRLPGFPHQKDPANPWMVRVTLESCYPRYSILAVMRSLGIDPTSTLSPTQPDHPATPDLDEEKNSLTDADRELTLQALTAIPPNGYHQWIQIGMALHHATGGGQDGLEMWDQWSRAGDTYRDGEPTRKWGTFGRSSENREPITLGTLFTIAEGHGWVNPNTEVRPTANEDFQGGGDEESAGGSDNKPKEAGKKGKGKREKLPKVVLDMGVAMSLTDAGNAARFASQHYEVARYCKEWNAWMTWAIRKWEKDDAFQRQRLAEQTVMSIKAEADAMNNPDVANAFKAHMKRSLGDNALTAMVNRARGRMAISTQQFPKNSWMLNCQNGVVDLRTGALVPHNPRYFMTQETLVDYIPNAYAPRWVAFIDEIMGGDREMTAFLQRAVGSALIEEIRDQVAFFMLGTGNNGKSVFLGTLLSILGMDYATKIPKSILTNSLIAPHPTDASSLVGKRLGVLEEFPSRDDLNIDNLKLYAGGGKDISRRMGENFSMHDITVKMFISTNSEPEIKENTWAVWRRIVMIPFNVTFSPEQQDEGLPARLLAEESAGILAWMVEGCLAWQRDGLRPPVKVRRASEVYRTNMDPLSDFVEERCVKGPRAAVSANDLYGAYVEHQNANRAVPESQQKFGRMMAEKGFVKERTKTTRRYHGITLRSNPTWSDAILPDGREVHDMLEKG